MQLLILRKNQFAFSQLLNQSLLLLLLFGVDQIEVVVLAADFREKLLLLEKLLLKRIQKPVLRLQIFHFLPQAIHLVKSLQLYFSLFKLDYRGDGLPLKSLEQVSQVAPVKEFARLLANNHVDDLEQLLRGVLFANVAVYLLDEHSALVLVSFDLICGIFFL